MTKRTVEERQEIGIQSEDYQRMTRNKFNLIQKRRFQDEADDRPRGGIEGEGTGAGGEGEGNAPDPKPTDKEAQLLKEVMKGKDKLREVTSALDAARNDLKRFEGIDPEAVRTLLQERQEREQAELEKRGEFDRVKQQMIEAHERQLGEIRTGLEGQVSTLSEQLAAATHAITELTIGRAFGDSPFVRETLTLTPAKARVVYGNHFELQDGQVVAYDKPAGASDRTVLVDGQGNPLPFDKAIEAIVKADPDADFLMRSKIKPGAGSKTESEHKPTPKVGAGRDRIAAAVNGGALVLPK